MVCQPEGLMAWEVVSGYKYGRKFYQAILWYAVLDTFHDPLLILLVLPVPGTFDLCSSKHFVENSATFRKAQFHNPLAFCSSTLLPWASLLVGSHDSALRSAGVPRHDPKVWGFMTCWGDLPPERDGTCRYVLFHPGTGSLELQFPAPLWR